MNSLKDSLTFTVPLTLREHQIAQQFYKQQANPNKAKQVYLNTLAVYAVKFYLSCLGIETEWSTSDSWHPAMQTLADTADLKIKDLGKLECRPVLPEARSCWIPPEVWSDRIGYVAVQFDRSLTQATLVGFVPTADREEFPLNQLRSLADMVEHLNQLKQPQLAKERVVLSQWLHHIFEVGWEAVEWLLEPPQAGLAFRFRGAAQTKTVLAEDSTSGVKRGKQLSLERVGEAVVLCVELKPVVSEETNISVEVYPTKGQSYLPQDLQLMVLDERGEAVMQAIARSTRTIQLLFSGKQGEHFSVKVALGDVSVTEAFLI